MVARAARERLWLPNPIRSDRGDVSLLNYHIKIIFDISKGHWESIKLSFNSFNISIGTEAVSGGVGNRRDAFLHTTTEMESFACGKQSHTMWMRRGIRNVCFLLFSAIHFTLE